MAAILSRPQCVNTEYSMKYVHDFVWFIKLSSLYRELILFSVIHITKTDRYLIIE